MATRQKQKPQLDSLGFPTTKLKLTDEVGSTGLKRTGSLGSLYEEFLRDLYGDRAFRIYHEMRDNDPVIGAMFFAIEMLIRKVKWRVEGENQESVEFIESCLTDMSHTFEDFITEVLSMLTYGWSWHEIVYKRRLGPSDDPTRRSRFNDGKIGWRKIPIRAQDTRILWKFDDEGGIQGIIQSAPPFYRATFIPIDRSILFRVGLHKGNPEGRSLLRNAYRCFDEKTEILTKDGWKFGLALSEKDEVATLVKGKLVYERPSKLHQYDYSGKLVRAKSRFLDQFVTPNHRMWVKRGAADFDFIDADNLSVSDIFKRDAKWSGAKQDFYTIPSWVKQQKSRNGHLFLKEHRPAVKVPMEIWLRFMGVLLAEGYCGPENQQATIVITQNKGDKADKIWEWLQALPFHVHKGKPDAGGKINFVITNAQLWSHLKPIMEKARNKRIPRFIGTLSRFQIQTFLEAFHLGDGSYCGGFNGYEGTKLYWTGSKGLADDLSELVLKAGGCPSIREVFTGGFVPQDGVERPMWCVTNGKSMATKARHISKKHYRGKVWCVTTDSGIVYVRRNGKCQWSGNSWYFKKRIEEIEAIGIERDVAGIPVIYRTADLADKYDAALKEMVRNIKRDEQEGIILPLAYDENKNKKLTLELLTTGGKRQLDISSVIDRYDKRIAMTVIADFLLMGQQAVGSFALADSKTDMFADAIKAILDSIASLLNRIAIPRLLRLNGLKNTEDEVKLVPGDLETPDLDKLGKYVTALAGAGMPMFPDPELEDYFRKAANLPQKPNDSARLPVTPKPKTPKGKVLPGDKLPNDDNRNPKNN